MEFFETLQALELAVSTLSKIEALSIDEDIREQLTTKVLACINIEKTKSRKHTPGSQNKILESLKKFGGSAMRSDIASDSGLDPNVVSSQLNKLVKRNRVEKVKIDPANSNSNRNGRGLNPEYIYKLVGEDNAKVTVVDGEEISQS